MNIKKIGIIGAGQMGRGVAQVAALSGYETKVFDLNNEILETSRSFIEKQLSKGLEKEKYTQDQVSSAGELLSFTAKIEDLKDFDLIIEAATEKKDIKFKIFQDLDNRVKKEAILASNTSSISITEIAAQTKRPSQVCGMHFMNPVPIMKLVEGIKGLETSDETFNAVQAVSEKMGKVFVKSNDVPGFIVNRVLMPMINEAAYAVYEGIASIEDIDTAMKLGTNQPMGPLTLADFIGLDTCLYIMEVLHEGLGDTKYRPCPLLKKYVAAGRLGRKSKQGFYKY